MPAAAQTIRLAVDPVRPADGPRPRGPTSACRLRALMAPLSLFAELNSGCRDRDVIFIARAADQRALTATRVV